MTKEQQREYFRRRYEEAKLAYDAFIEYYPLTLDDLDGEIWRLIEGFDKYQVSTFGRVKSFWEKSPQILKPYLIGEYLSVDLFFGGERKHRTIHTLVAKAFIPNPDNKPEVNHDDGHKLNCHISNLYWATSSENQQHALRTGLRKSGIDRSDAKIKDESDIIYIRDNPDNLTTYELAAMFGVKQQTIGLIQRGKRYPNEGGTIRESKAKHASDEERAQIKADWATGLYKSYSALGRKYGCCHKTIKRIVNEG